MKKPDVPQDEELRLQTLRSLNILDTAPEERFDRVTRLARRVFDVPIALVSLVDKNRQWFKSHEGLDSSETPRDVSFCGHAILGSDVFVIPDAKKDERFADNPLVLQEPYVRFYAGCPLRSHNGMKLGTLCIVDHKPRTLSDGDLDTLIDLASMVERELAALQLATLDELTQISNRRGFAALAQYSLSLCARQDIPACLVFLDLNNFKLINDNFGHAEGDRALIAFADHMRIGFRDSDLFARLSGDEFVVLLTNTSEKIAEEVLARFQQSLDEYNRAADRDYAITFSYGIVEYVHDKHQTLEALLEDGDTFMYERKKERNRASQKRILAIFQSAKSSSGTD